MKGMLCGASQAFDVATDGCEGNGLSLWPPMSCGTVIAFESACSSLVAGDTNGTSDVFAVRNLLYVTLEGVDGNWSPEMRREQTIDDVLNVLDRPDGALSINFNDHFFDPAGGTLMFAMTGINAGLVLDPLRDQISGRFAGELAPDDSVSFMASDPGGASLSTGTTLCGFGFPSLPDPWVFDYARLADLMIFVHLTLDSYNGDGQAALNTSNDLHPPEGWTVLFTTFYGAGPRPTVEGRPANTITPTRDGMQATAYLEGGTGRIAIAYHGTDDNGELLSASIPMGLGEPCSVGPVRYLQAAGMAQLCCTNRVRDSSCETSRRIFPTYKTTNWPAYNEALKRRGALTIWFDPEMVWDATPSGKRGRQQSYSDAAIQTCLTTARRGIAEQCPERG
jgi:hypothetical protein